MLLNAISLSDAFSICPHYNPPFLRWPPIYWVITTACVLLASEERACVRRSLVPGGTEGGPLCNFVLRAMMQKMSDE